MALVTVTAKIEQAMIEKIDAKVAEIERLPGASSSRSAVIALALERFFMCDCPVHSPRIDPSTAQKAAA